MITKKNIHHIAKLARLALTSKETKKYQRELSTILDYMEKLKKVDTRKVPPTSHPRLAENVMRKDVVKFQPIERINKLIKAAPGTKKRYIKVKRVL